MTISNRHSSVPATHPKSGPRRCATRLALAVFVATAIGCATNLKVSTDYDPAADWSRYHTFAWLDQPTRETGDYRLDSPLLAERLIRAVNDALPARGLTQVEPEQADLLVGYHLSIEEKVNITTIDRHYGYGASWRYRGMGAGYSETYVTQYEQGTLVIDLVDAKSEQLVWRGAAQSRLRSTATPGESQQRAQEVVSRLLAHYPPGGASDSAETEDSNGDAIGDKE